MAPVRIGCSGWIYRSWRESGFYPPGCPQRLWLERYATRFDTVELNNTFYRLPKRDAVAAWVQRTPDDFVFTVKASRYLTHMKRLTDMAQGVEKLWERLQPLVESPKMGPVLWQLPGNFQRDDERLGHALSHLPPGHHAFELPPPVVVRRRRPGAAARAPRRAGHRRPPRPALAAARPDQRLHPHPLPLRPSRPARQLQRGRAARMGGADRAAARRDGGLRVLQQRLGGLCAAQRGAVAAASATTMSV